MIFHVLLQLKQRIHESWSRCFIHVSVKRFRTGLIHVKHTESGPVLLPGEKLCFFSVLTAFVFPYRGAGTAAGPPVLVWGWCHLIRRAAGVTSPPMTPQVLKTFVWATAWFLQCVFITLHFMHQRNTKNMTYIIFSWETKENKKISTWIDPCTLPVLFYTSQGEPTQTDKQMSCFLVTVMLKQEW